MRLLAALALQLQRELDVSAAAVREAAHALLALQPHHATHIAIVFPPCIAYLGTYFTAERNRAVGLKGTHVRAFQLNSGWEALWKRSKARQHR